MTTRPALAPVRAALMLCLAVLASGVLTQRVSAQGTDGLFADPISTRELTDYAQMLRLSPEQLVAVESMHDDYKRAYTALRDGPVAELMKETRALQGRLPNRSMIVKFLRDFDALSGRIRALDDSLFDRILGVLSDEQAAIVPRARLRRERARYAKQPMLQMTGGPIVDLSELVRRIDLDAEELAAIDPTLADYEQRFTVQVRDLGEDMSRFILKMFDAFLDAGLGDISEEDMADPEIQQRMMEVQRTAMTEIFGDATRRMRHLSDYSERTLPLLVENMSDRHGDQLRVDFYRTAYPELGMFFYGNRIPTVEDVIDATEPAQHEAIRELLEPAHARLEGLFQRALKLTKTYKKNTSVFDMDPETMQTYQQELQELQTEAGTMCGEVLTELVELIGSDEAMSLQRTAMARASGRSTDLAAATEIVASDEDDAFVWSGDSHVASRITQRDLRRYAKALDLTPDRYVLLEELYRTYVDRYQEAGLAQRVQEAASALWTTDPATNLTIPADDREIEHLTRVRRETTAALHDLDEVFFDEVASSLATEDDADRMQHLRRSREAQLYRLQGTQWYGAGGNRAAQATVDLTELVVASTDADSFPADAEAILVAHEQASLPVLRRRYDALLDLQAANERWTASAQRQYRETGNYDTTDMYGTLVQPAQTLVNAVDDELGTMNETTLDALIAAVPNEVAARLRIDFHRKAYPEVYEDRIAVTRHLTRALELDDVSDDQRETLIELTASYRPAYDEHSLRLIEINVNRRPMYPTADASDWREWQKRREEAERVRFERDELSYRAINRLRAILTERQIREIGGLPATTSAALR